MIKYHKFNISRFLQRLSAEGRQWVVDVQAIRRALESRAQSYFDNPTYVNKTGFKSGWYNANKYLKTIVAERPTALKAKVVIDLNNALNVLQPEYEKAKVA